MKTLKILQDWNGNDVELGRDNRGDAIFKLDIKLISEIKIKDNYLYIELINGFSRNFILTEKDGFGHSFTIS